MSHDIKPIPGFVRDRIAAGLSMPGVLLLHSSVSLAVAIDELEAITVASQADEWVNQIAYLPLR